jgi:hypothetical protein
MRSNAAPLFVRGHTSWPEQVVSSTKAFKRAIGYSFRVLTQEDTEHMVINVKPLGDRVDPHADRYGDPEGVNLTTLMPGSYDHVVAAPHCDRYGSRRRK